MNKPLLITCFALVLLGRPVLADETTAWTQLDDTQWVVLFDGTSAAAWRGYNKAEMPAGWVVADGTLHRQQGGGDIITRQQFGDFVLELEWKISESGNSGIMYRVSEGDSAPYISGPEYQILDASNTEGENLLHSAGALYGLYKADPAAFKPAGQWNHAMIVFHGNHVEHWLNGRKIVDCELASEDWNQRVANSKFASWEKFGKNRTGHIALQDHGNPVWYRKIRIHEIAANDDQQHQQESSASAR